MSGEKTGMGPGMIPKRVVTDGPVVTKASARGLASFYVCLIYLGAGVPTPCWNYGAPNTASSSSTSVGLASLISVSIFPSTPIFGLRESSAHFSWSGVQRPSPNSHKLH